MKASLISLATLLLVLTGCSNNDHTSSTSDTTLIKIIHDKYAADIKSAGAGNVTIDTLNIIGKTMMKRTPEIWSIEYYISGRIFSAAGNTDSSSPGLRFSKKEVAQLQVKDDSTGNWLSGLTFP